jgi:uncharacterized membrane protein YvbJ
MKTYVKITILFVVVALIVFAAYATRRVSAPESAIIAHERDALYAARDKDRMEKDAIYAVEMRDRLQFLDLRIASAYLAENDPDAAIAVIRKLIAEEEAHAAGGVARRSRSYVNEMRFYETLKNAYELKKDEAGVKNATDAYDALLLKAAEARTRESREEGKHVGLAGD